MLNEIEIYFIILLCRCQPHRDVLQRNQTFDPFSAEVEQLSLHSNLFVRFFTGTSLFQKKGQCHVPSWNFVKSFKNMVKNS